jgi:hypothetical protein
MFELEKLLQQERKSPRSWKGRTPRGGWRKCSFACRDHLGRLYASKKQRADAYGQNHTTVDFRLKSGWTLEEALTVPKLDPHGRHDGIRKIRESRQEA